MPTEPCRKTPCRKTPTLRLLPTPRPVGRQLVSCQDRRQACTPTGGDDVHREATNFEVETPEREATAPGVERRVDSRVPIGAVSR